MNNRGFTKGERLDHAILEGRTVRPTCPECGKPVHSDILTRFPKCVGLRCRPCRWEGEPISTLNAALVMVRADAAGLPTSEVLV